MMHRVRVAPDHRHFLRDEKPFFLMADTAWSAFTNPTLEEWEEYLALRKKQGFNTLLINVLPQWDRGLAKGERACPWVTADDVEWRLADIPESYFDHACRVLDKMMEYDMTPVLVLLWGNYTNGTFFDTLWGHSPIARDGVEEYVTYVARRFAGYAPLYFVSGDTTFTDQSVDDYYRPALHALKAADPEALASLHICGDDANTPEVIERCIPQRLLYDELLDFYTYQSGHFDHLERRCRDCAKAFAGIRVKKPIFNAEPCYEGWDTPTGAHGRREMRRAAYISILSGASAGLGHGVQGVWQWYRPGDFFAPTHETKKRPLYHTSEPFFIRDALELPGSEDRSFAAQLVEKHGLYAMEPVEAFDSDYPDVYMAETPDQRGFMLYLPRNQKVLVKLNPDAYDLTEYLLKERVTVPVFLTPVEEGFVLEAVGKNSDFVLVGEKKE